MALWLRYDAGMVGLSEALLLGYGGMLAVSCLLGVALCRVAQASSEQSTTDLREALSWTPIPAATRVVER